MPESLRNYRQRTPLASNGSRANVAEDAALLPFGFGIFTRLNNAETVAEIELGFNGVPSGSAKIRSRSFR
jgi:hypothetical protein